MTISVRTAELEAVKWRAKVHAPHSLAGEEQARADRLFLLGELAERDGLLRRVWAWAPAACWANLSDTGAIFYNHKPRSIGGRLWLPLELIPDLPLRQIVVWARAGGMNFTETAYVPTHEWVMILAKPDWRLRAKEASGLGDVWRVPQEANPDHPAPFPVGLPARAIETTSPGAVLDPFMGSGSTLMASKAAGARAIGIEISERYCEIAARRCSQEVLGLSAPRSGTQPVSRDHGTAVGVSADVAEPQSGAPKEGHSPAGPGLSLAAAIPLSTGAPLP